MDRRKKQKITNSTTSIVDNPTSISNKKYAFWDAFFFCFITIIGLLKGEVTIFYILYLFWFQELLRSIISLVFLKKIAKDKSIFMDTIQFGIGMFLMFIYLIFITVFMGYAPFWENEKATSQITDTLLLMNLYFDFNLLIFAAQMIYYYSQNKNEAELQENIKPFNLNHIVLHVSIIFGGFLTFGSIWDGDKSQENSWATILPVIPFLIIRIVLTPDLIKKYSPKIQKNKK